MIFSSFFSETTFLLPLVFFVLVWILSKPRIRTLVWVRCSIQGFFFLCELICESLLGLFSFTGTSFSPALFLRKFLCCFYHHLRLKLYFKYTPLKKKILFGSMHLYSYVTLHATLSSFFSTKEMLLPECHCILLSFYNYIHSFHDIIYIYMAYLTESCLYLSSRSLALTRDRTL